MEKPLITRKSYICAIVMCSVMSVLAFALFIVVKVTTNDYVTVTATVADIYSKYKSGALIHRA